MLGLPFKMIVVLLDLPKLELPFKMTPYFPKLDLKSIIPFAENLKSELLGGIIALFIVGLTYIYYRMKKPKGMPLLLDFVCIIFNYIPTSHLIDIEINLLSAAPLI